MALASTIDLPLSTFDLRLWASSLSLFMFFFRFFSLLPVKKGRKNDSGMNFCR